jgi:hypothetical protein
MTMASIKLILGDIEKLRTKYGLAQHPLDNPSPSETGIQSSRIQASLDAMVLMQQGAEKTKASRSLRQAFTWSVVDREKFSMLVKDLREFNDSLCSILELGQKSRLERRLLETFLASEDAQELRSVSRALRNTPYATISASAEIKNRDIVCQASSANVSPSSRIHNDLPIASELQLDKEGILDLPASNERCIRVYHLEGPKRTPVIIEWKEYTRNLPQKELVLLHLNVYRLTACLHASSKPETFRTLDILGYIDDTNPTFGNPRFGFLYQFPNGSNESQEPVSLNSLLDCTKYFQKHPPELGSRFQLARCLSTSVYHLLAARWLHKGIRSHNIIFFETGSVVYPYMVGFDHSRPDHPKEASVKDESYPEFDRYRHPNYLSSKSQRYSKKYDVYALGVLLLEIGMWAPVASLHKAKYSLQEFQQRMRTMYVEELVPRMGQIYADVVKRCLVGIDNEDFGAEEGGLQHWLGEFVVGELYKCRA